MSEQRTALVVLKPGRGDPAWSGRAAERPPDQAAVDEVVMWFRQQGFETGPFVGISFSVSGSDQLFRSVLGEGRHAAGGSGEVAFGLDAVDERVASYLDAVVVPAPPDFGPGNP